MQPKYIHSIENVPYLTEKEKAALQIVTEKFMFRVNDYYLNLIDWSNPEDPLRKLVIPNLDELTDYGRWDASDEDTNYVVKGCQHKYKATALLIVSEVCGAYCRYCFRKRLFQPDVQEATSHIAAGLDYISQHEEISNVLLTGGDPLILSTARIKNILEQIRDIPHVHIIRIGSKMPVFNPMRIYEDEALLQTIADFSNANKRIYIMTHINHPHEITEQARRGFESLHQAGAILTNQTPILKGINDDADVLSSLLNKLSYAGVAPYYFFMNRPVIGNHSFALSLEAVYQLVEKAKSNVSGLGKRVKLVMSHTSGKIEILAVENGKAYLKYHQSRDGDEGKFMILPCPPTAAWFDDLPGSEQYWNQKM